MSGTIYNILLPKEKTRTQEFWNKNISILRNAVEGIPYHLGTLSALLGERLIFFQNEPTRNNGLLLLQAASTTWQIVRSLSGITRDENEWFRQQVKNPDSRVWSELGVTTFFEQMHEIFDIVSFLRHPSNKLMAYDWVFHGSWPKDKIDFTIQAASTLHSVINLAVTEFALASGWVGDSRKKNLYDTAIASSLSLGGTVK